MVSAYSQVCLLIDKSSWCWGGNEHIYPKHWRKALSLNKMAEVLPRPVSFIWMKMESIFEHRIKFIYHQGGILNIANGGKVWIIEPGKIPPHNYYAEKNEFASYDQISEITTFGSGLCFIRIGEVYCSALDSRRVGDGGFCEKMPQEKDRHGYMTSACMTKAHKVLFWDQIPPKERKKALEPIKIKLSSE